MSSGTKPLILIADDEARMRKLVRDFLAMESYEVLEAANGEKALELFFAHPETALVILDVMMPGMDGLAVAREIRARTEVPLILLTALGAESDELKGFASGADEYITKPFSPRILVARVNALLRRSGQEQEAHAVLSAGDIVLDEKAHEVRIGDNAVELSFKEYELLRFFMMHKGQALTRETILNRVWDYDYFGDARTVDTHVKKLRAKLGAAGASIKTVWGVGYKFE